MLLLLPIVLSVTTVYSTSRISAPGFQAVNFAQAKERRKLNGSVIKQVDVRSEDECSLQCVRNEGCLSYNFENTKNESGTFACELSNSDRFPGFGNFTEHDNFTYRGIQVKIPIFDEFFLLINNVSFSQPGKFIWLLCQQQLQYITPKKERPLHVLYRRLLYRGSVRYILLWLLQGHRITIVIPWTSL